VNAVVLADIKRGKMGFEDGHFIYEVTEFIEKR
jgi:hypothetical protein